MPRTRKITAGRETGYGAGVLIFAKDIGKFLWIRRSAGSDYPGCWCVPGGGVEDYETIEQGVRREVAEEIGYTGPLPLYHMHRDAQDNGFIFFNHYSAVDKAFEPVLNGEHTEYVWSAQPPSPIHPRLKLCLDAWQERAASNP